MGADASSSTVTRARRERRLVTIAVAAEYVDVHPRTLRRWIAAGRLPAYRLGPRLIKLDLDELDEFMRPVTCTQRLRRSS
jgi:excisionase family DNA binding protein